MNGKDTALFSSNSDEYETPRWLFEQLDREFHFECDAAATAKNTKCGHYFSGDVLSAIDLQNWGGKTYMVFWLNPPYSKVAAFMKKAYEESLKGAIVVCLIPSRTDTRYWHEYCMKAHEIRFIHGRLKFGDGKGSAPFPSCVVIFDHSKYDKNNDPLMRQLKRHTHLSTTGRYGN